MTQSYTCIWVVCVIKKLLCLGGQGRHTWQITHHRQGKSKRQVCSHNSLTFGWVLVNPQSFSLIPLLPLKNVWLEILSLQYDHRLQNRTNHFSTETHRCCFLVGVSFSVISGMVSEKRAWRKLGKELMITALYRLLSTHSLHHFAFDHKDKATLHSTKKSISLL